MTNTNTIIESLTEEFSSHLYALLQGEQKPTRKDAMEIGKQFYGLSTAEAIRIVKQQFGEVRVSK
jgi:hypothetical protein